jgi:hypothetical protein
VTTKTKKQQNPDAPRVWTFGKVDFSIEARARLKGAKQ